MKNKALFKATVEESGKIRFDINENLHKQMNNLAKIFKAVSQDESKVFFVLKDMEYYTGGYPSENSPPKLDEVLDKFAIFYKIKGE